MTISDDDPYQWCRNCPYPAAVRVGTQERECQPCYSYRRRTGRSRPENLFGSRKNRPTIAGKSRREAAVKLLALEGYHVSQIAKVLEIAPSTVRGYLQM